MMRYWISHHYPHALLLAGSAVCLSIALSAPQHKHATHNAQPDQARARQASSDTFTTHYPSAKTQSLAEFLRLARIKYQRNHPDQPDAGDGSNDAQVPPALTNEDASQHQMIQRRDFASLPKVTDPLATDHPEYAYVVDPLDLIQPDALPTREYVILGFGEVGQEQPADSSSNNDTLIQVPPTPTLIDAFTTLDKADVPDADLTPLAVPQVQAIPIAQPTTTVDAAPIAASISIKQTASQPAPTPVASRAVPLTTKTETNPTPKLRQPEQPTVASKRTASTDTPTTTEPHTKTPPVITKLTPSSNDPSPTAQGHKDKPALTKTPEPTDTKQPLAHPTKNQDKPSPTRVASKTPDAISPKTKTEKPKPDSRPHQPTTPDKIVSTKPLHTNPSTATNSPAKATSKATNPLVVLIDDYDSISSDRLNAIDNALSRINQAAKKADIGLELKVTTDKHADHNIRFRENDGKDMGNLLGLAQFAVTEDAQGNEFFLGENNRAQGGIAQIDINDSFNWFAGEDENEIGGNQYDYQTAVEHEFFHLLGIDDDFDNLQAVSHGLLGLGETRRDFDDHEINELATLFTSHNAWQPQPNPPPSPGNNKGKVRYKFKALTAAIPEPTSAALIGVGVVIGTVRRRR